jgi:hypothetical protein
VRPLERMTPWPGNARELENFIERSGEYPREPLLRAVREAGRYGLYDLDRLERMILRRVTREYFLLDPS